MAFTASARIPCRPLSYDNVSMAMPKEFIIDYTSHKLYLSDIDGNIVDITFNIDDIMDQIMDQINSNLDIGSLTITIDGNDVELAVAIKDIYDKLSTSHRDCLQRSGGTMIGALIAHNNTAYSTKQVRNIFLIADGETIPAGANGDICLVYSP